MAPRMRTIDKAAEYIKEQDPDTALTKTALRRLVVSGALPSVAVGSKYLIALENVEALCMGEQTVEHHMAADGVIRPVELI